MTKAAKTTKEPSKRDKAGNGKRPGSGQAKDGSGRELSKEAETLPTSQLFLKDDWPVGYTARMLDSMTVEAVNSVLDRELKRRKLDTKKNNPGNFSHHALLSIVCQQIT